MIKLFATLSFILLNQIWIYSQEVFNTSDNEEKYYISLHFGLGTTFIPKGGNNKQLNIHFQKKNNFGYGFDLFSSNYSNLNRNPSASEINNYNPNNDGQIPDRFLINGDYNDSFKSFSFYISKELNLSNEKIRFNFQIGPSFNFIDQRLFEYNYSPGNPGSFFCFISCGSPPSIWVESSRLSKFNMGGYFRLNTQIKFWTNTVIEISPFTNINGRETLVGFQIGFVFGRGYKLHFFEAIY